MVPFRSATRVAFIGLAALFNASVHAAPEAVPTVPAKIRWLDATVSWDTANRRGYAKAQMEIELKQEGFPLLGLKAVPNLIQWDGSALHPSMFAQVAGKKGYHYLQVKVAPGTIHRLDIEYESALEKVEAVPVALETIATPFVLRFDDPQFPDHELQTNGLALAAGEGKWAVRFPESTEGVYLALPEFHDSDRKPGGFKKLVRWFLSLPFAILGGGGEGPPPLINYHKKPH